ncbi:MAG: DUF104 domain-containing protein [Nanoarchaeota archaeon]|nr:DUF104 domain-containing protein [Nanoarchaeota archaeon]
MENKEIKVKFVNGQFVPIDKVDFRDGEVIDIEIVAKKEPFSWRGALKQIKKKSVELQHDIKDEW